MARSYGPLTGKQAAALAALLLAPASSASSRAVEARQMLGLARRTFYARAMTLARLGYVGSLWEDFAPTAAGRSALMRAMEAGWGLPETKQERSGMKSNKADNPKRSGEMKQFKPSSKALYP